ncbi:acetyl-CoA carboxylase biotin carboxyl carrier protein subunit [Novosphingobium resinovorum]|uniref:acetyl-CoA carboxylase biotin carboxyl carrier protein subunit n=1 Tax=Novosphingobium resinovorum TaxID=158500 RepID=UPI002ECFDAFA|nr:acetyl-CoA carboxylase biotin carboxyl carrier protein subunit [Novosphingobium resinovorum]
MTSPIHDIRAMLLQFERSPLKDLYFRSADWSLFLARPDGGANPLLALEEQAVEAVVASAQAIVSQAPHLGLFEPCCAPGDAVKIGDVLARLDVLGRKTEVVSAASGIVSAVRAAANDLVEFGDELVEVEAA